MLFAMLHPSIRPISLLATAALLSLSTWAPAQDQRTTTSQQGMVVSVSAEGSDAGSEILRKGGNAVDAAVATALAMAVTHPSAGNIGGGGFMIVHPTDGSPPVMIDYRELAPKAATVDMYTENYSSIGPKVVGVPGTVRGLALAHKTFGKLSWQDVVMPAVKLAEEGFIMHDGLARSLNGTVARYAEQIPELARVYGKDGGEGEWQGGDRLILKDLGRTLRMIAEDGPDAFYLGEIADLLVAEMERSGGLITKADLRDYEAKIREPIHATFRGYDIYGPAPPSSGGICLAMMLNILENFDLKAQGRYSTKTMHLIIESMRRAYSDRAKYLGDQDFVDIPSHLTTKEYAKELAASIDLELATPSVDLAPPIKLAGEGEETTHFSVVDSTGMMVSNTYTLEQGYGSKVVVGGAGFLLNNEMGDFNRNPGVTNTRGGIGTKPNLIEPGKRMLSSMTPVVVTKDGVPVLVTGSPGGRTIINTVLCVTLNVLEFDMNVRDAVDAPRMDHEWFPNRIRFGGANDPEHQAMVEALRAMGHDIVPGGQGDANSIQIIDGVFYGAADGSRGKASGY